MDDIFKRIHLQLRNYQYVYGKQPNAIFIGHEEYNELRDSTKVFNKFFNYAVQSNEGKFETIFGIKFYRVIEEHHLSVGFIEKEVI